jgi:hypothetical protein
MQRSVMTWKSYYIKPRRINHQVVKNSIQSSSSEVLTQESFLLEATHLLFLCFYFAEGLEEIASSSEKLDK